MPSERIKYIVSVLLRVLQIIVAAAAIALSGLIIAATKEIGMAICLAICSISCIYPCLILAFTQHIHPLVVMIFDPLVALSLVGAISLSVSFCNSYQGSSAGSTSFMSNNIANATIGMVGSSLLLYAMSTLVISCYIAFFYYRFDHDSHLMIRGGLFLSLTDSYFEESQSQNAEILQNPMFEDTLIFFPSHGREHLKPKRPSRIYITNSSDEEESVAKQDLQEKRPTPSQNSSDFSGCSADIVLVFHSEKNMTGA